MEMIADAKSRQFDLIVTREVCRFARNTVDTLVVTRELKEYGVEVYFVEDNIWTMDGDGELRLSLMATLAQEESRKTSERVRAGQKISRDKGVLYGNGNILGYDRVGDTYVINKEQAETVKIIYDLYLKGYGFQKIVNELVRLKRRDASGLIRWECTKVSRILHNATYKGYQGYLKSYKNNFLDQKTIINHDEDTYLYVKGKFEPIIPEDIWDKCKAIRESKTIRRKNRNGEAIKQGIRRCDNIWVKKMVCKCGYHFRMDKWHINKTGITYGYKCYNQLNNGSKQSRIEAGLPSEKFCDMGTIADWKMDMMVWYIMRELNFSSKRIVSDSYNLFIQAHRQQQISNNFIDDLVRQKDKEQQKLENLTEMRINGELTKEEFQTYKNKITVNISKIESRIEELRKKEEEEKTKRQANISFDDFVRLLSEEIDFSKPAISEGLISVLINKVVPSNSQEFNWYLNLFPHTNEEEIKFREIESFTIDFQKAHEFRKLRGELLRSNQWRDLVVHIYI